ncbi:MAG: SIMPL domain-containing protein [Bacteroidetes bacterium]|nr:SIMPL domain-containing protein [Bacteroidota bacterium]
MTKRIIWIVFIVLITTISAIAQTETRTVEVSGLATKKFPADVIYYEVNVSQGEPCEIAHGKNYTKYIKECQENNKKLSATRENVLKGIIESFGTRIKQDKKSESKYSEYVASLSYQLIFSNQADLLDFEMKLADYKDAFSGSVKYAAYSKMDEAMQRNLVIESLTDARKRADEMAKALGATVDKVIGIYEEKPSGSSMNSYLEEVMKVSMYKELYQIQGESKYATMMDAEGNVSYSGSSFVKFSLK